MFRGEHLCWVVGISGKEDRLWGGGGSDLEQCGGCVYRSEVWQIRLKRGGV